MNIPRYRRRLTLALIAAGLLLSTGCWAQPPEIHPWFGATATAPDGATIPATADGSETVVLFGDSIGAMAETTAKAQIKVIAPNQTWSYNAQGGTQIDQWSAPMATRCPTLPDGTPILETPCVPVNGTVVAELLTNDVTLNDHYQIDVDLIAALDSLADVRCVVVPLLNTEGGDRRGTPYSSRTHWVNDRLEQLVADGTYPNLHLIPWDDMTAGQPQLLMGNAATPVDWVHYNGVGNPVVADMIAHAPEACSS